MTEIKGACPHHGTNTNGSDSYVFNPDKGVGMCHSCGLSTWTDEHGRLWGRPNKQKKAVLIEGDSNVVEEEEYIVEESNSGGTYKPMRNISKDTMEFFGVVTYEPEGGRAYQEYVYPSGGIKVRYLPKDFSAKNGFKGDELFGMNLFSAGCSKVVVVTEGELDALSAWQMLQKGSYVNPVVSFPSASPSSKLWEKCKKYLDSFDKIILSVDNDEPGQKLSEQVSEIFPDKTFIMNHGSLKDANDFLQAGLATEYKQAWWNAKKYKPDSILSDSDDYLKLYDDSPDFEYFQTGIKELDEKMLGICKGYVTLIQAETGLGKSLAPETPVLKYSGEVVRADEVQVGDQLMGPDSKPRNVTNVNLQQGPMYRVTPVKGEPFECNSDHILSLRHTTTKEVKNVKITDYLTWGVTEKRMWKLYRAAVDFPMCGPNRPTFAYAVGAYLGDGRKQGPELCMGKAKQPVIDYLMDSGNLKPSRMKFERGAYYIGFSKDSYLWDYLSNRTGQSEDCLSVRRMPTSMKRGHVETRSAILAGLLDTDGSITPGGGGVEITQKSEALADDICFVSRSLGLAAYKKSKWVNGSEYFRVGISGDMSKIPCKRLKFQPRKQIKDVLHTGFTVEATGEGTYRGIALDGDHLFLLGDFTVTHNTEFTRYLEWQALNSSEYKIAAMHLEETKLRSLLGLVSYKLGENVTIKKFIDEKGLDQEVRESIAELSETERFITFDFDMQGGHDELIKQVRYLVAAMNVDFIFVEPIQDCVTGTASEKESKLSDLITQLSTLASKLNVGIVVVAHQNADGGSMYSSMITKRAAFELLLKRDRDSDNPVEKNRTHVVIGRKNRTGLGQGSAGALDFDLESYTLTPVDPPKEPKVDRKDDF